jgi:glycosyltransferase involved in cell wall biosynthesis
MPPVSRRKLKQSLGLDPGCTLIAAFGYLNPSKQLEAAIEAFSRLRGQFPAAHFVCVGEVVPGYPFGRALRRLGLASVAKVTGFVTPAVFQRYLRAADIGVNLRQPAWGESSATLISLMRCGVPTLVSDAGPFTEVPDDAVVKVPARGDAVEELVCALRGLLSQPRRREKIGGAAQLYVASRCRPERAAAAYATFIGSVTRGAASRLAAQPLRLQPAPRLRRASCRPGSSPWAGA